MIGKKNNTYKIILEEVALKDTSQSGKKIAFSFENHDNIFEIIDKIEAKNLFNSKYHDIEFAVGLKLFSEVLLRHNKHPLFEELKPAFAQFMKKLKST